MSPQLWSVIALVAMFAVATGLNLNIGALGLVAAFVIGLTVGSLSLEVVFGLFPADLFVLIVGLTYLLGLAKLNGTVDWLVGLAERAVRGRPGMLPWALFAASVALCTVLGPITVPLFASIGAVFVRRYHIRPLLIVAVIVFGAQGGSFSPVAGYGAIISSVTDRLGLPPGSWGLYACVLVFNSLATLVAYLVLGGRSSNEARTGGAPAAPKPDRTSPADDADPAGGAVLTAAPPAPGITRPTAIQAATTAGIVVLLVLGGFFGFDIGLTALTVALILVALSRPEQRERAVDEITWPIVLLVCGVLTYIGVLEKMGTISWLTGVVSGIATPLVATLVLCYIAAIVSALASSLAIIALLVTLAVPMMTSGEVSVLGTIAAISVSATIVDCSPFSTWGALSLANLHGVDRTRLQRSMLVMAGVVVIVAPAVAWAGFVLPGWLP
jgi:Na+/H+ antiporter NhaD/arsenite permease-like protein